MGKVTSKLQLTVPKAIADRFGIRPGDELQWIPTGDTIRVAPNRAGQTGSTPSLQQRLELFDIATARQQRRQAGSRRNPAVAPQRQARGWKREDLYRRGIAD